MNNESNMVEKTAEDYSKFIHTTNIDKKLEPLNKSIDDMLARLEEFETMVSFVQPDVKDAKDILTSILTYKNEFDELFEKIDSTEFLTAHIKNNLDRLEIEIEKNEVRLGCSDTTSKVTNMFTPLFKKNIERKPNSGGEMELFKTVDYFN